MKFTVCAVIVLFVASSNAEDVYNQGTRALLRVYDECNKAEFGLTACLKKKAITFIDRVARLDSLTVNEGFKIVKNSNAPELKVMSENELEKNLPRGLEARDEALTELLVEKAATFVSGRTVQVELPKLSTEELGRGLEEGRGKMKKMMSMMMAGFFMKLLSMVPVAIAGLYVLAGKALIVSKIALLLAGIIGLKKIIAQKQAGGGGQQGWAAGGGGGWERSIDQQMANHNLVYRAHK
ncbi:CLUMA_CG000867, isoform A [Clunio marinus]|uniref:CLUMA_CG000867, isoform A n=1 Tax=Clunio marinus TaxID=568069 RepID=A0A1J1HGW1_9DIPT|nr:CLUMA_CG000867, isoform A [Clunio marinus]